MTLGQMILKARTADGLTQRQLAELIDDMASNNDVSRWERDRHRPEIARMERLIEVLGLDEDGAWRAWRNPPRTAKRVDAP